MTQNESPVSPGTTPALILGIQRRPVFACPLPEATPKPAMMDYPTARTETYAGDIGLAAQPH
ncbi:MAG: hypothetical protein MK324_16015, partial [Pirellulales bacterium]|nr:hypothetical protein [Pirellulales bacterium]